MINSIFKHAIFSLAVAISLTTTLVKNCEASPYRGGIPVSFLLCKFSDSPTPPNDPTYYRNMTIASGTKSLNDYIKAISYGKADLSGSVVHGWYTEAHTLAYEQKLTNRWQRVQDCLDTAANSSTDRYVPPSGQKVYVITSPGVDLAGWENTAAIGGDDVPLPEIAHEFGHAIGLEHSWSNDVTWKDASWSGGGEYDNPWDLMSAANIYVDPTGAFQGGPVNLDAHHLDELGWLPKSRILTLGVDGVLSRTVTLASLSHPEASGYLMARIPFDSSDRFHYYTVEYRTANGWDSGIPANIVLINEIKNNSSYFQTTLIRELGSFAGTGDGPPVQTLNINGVTITVKNMSGNQSTVEISTKLAHQNPITYGPNTCQNGYVWRDGDDSDYVCVLPKIRTQTAYDNSQAANRRSPNGGTFGADTCKQGYVWREAWTGDHVCVTPATRSQAQSDNSQATQRLWNQQALLPEEPGQRFAILPALKKVKYIAAALKDIAEAPKTEPESPPPVSESVLRVRLTKLGYTEVRSLVHNGNNWDATVVMKNGVSHLIHFHAQTGRVIEKARVQP